MARRSLRPQLNQIRSWVRQGRTNAWIAHQLEVSARDIDSFKLEHSLTDESDGEGGLDEGERDLRAEDDALVAAELDALAESEPEPEDEEDGGGGDGADADEDADAAAKRRRGRRGGRRRGRGRGPRLLEGTFDHGEEGYGLWLDPGIQDNPVYAEHWAGHRPVTVTVEADRIVITRSGEDPAEVADGEAVAAVENGD